LPSYGAKLMPYIKVSEQKLHSAPRRFVDDGKYLASFADEILVRCAQCGSPGRVLAEGKPYRWKAIFKCANCDLSLNSEEGHWVGPVTVAGRRPCGYCGYKWLRTRVALKNPRIVPSKGEVKCPECHHISEVLLGIQRSTPHDHCLDPHFGMNLFLAHSGSLGTLWAYNARHLHVLTGYVQAKLRTRTGGGNSSMFSRLPAWIKLAKNRERVAKGLAKLNTLLANPALVRAHRARRTASR